MAPADRTALQVVPLERQHNRSEFSCGAPALENYIRRFARQDVARFVAAVFVLIEESAPDRIVGYYSLASTAIGLQNLPSEAT